ncbi:MAG: 50S ribosomal protein L15 [candidate division TM6 bacterium GW2011_GWF2_32_72]|nr:MAG: 50S ribosomal protein L15 [candidate division TM6 bacterium GW2011_GWF2_32_72]
MLTLNNLTPSGKNRKRVGRGGSRGGTSGKGNKGQKARSGAPIASYFEGGQMPLHRRLPKVGFNNTRFQKEIAIVNLQLLSDSFENGEQVNKEILREKGYLKGNRDILLKVLGGGELTKKLSIEADAFSKSAIDAIQKSGGEVILTKEK